MHHAWPVIKIPSAAPVAWLAPIDTSSGTPSGSNEVAVTVEFPTADPATLYAGLVGYEAGTVAWHLAWALLDPDDAGSTPTLRAVAGAPERTGIVFTEPINGGAPGTATLTATLDGVAIAGTLLATVEPLPVPPSIGWMDPIGAVDGTVAHANSGTGTFVMNVSGLVAGVVDYTDGVVVWSLDWTPVGSDPAPTLAVFGSLVSVDLPVIGFAATSNGQGILSATVDGVATDAVEFATAAGSYSLVAWGPTP